MPTTPVDEIASLAEQMERRLGAIREERAELSSRDEALAAQEATVEESLAVLRRGGNTSASATAATRRGATTRGAGSRGGSSRASGSRSGSRSSGARGGTTKASGSGRGSRSRAAAASGAAPAAAPAKPAATRKRASRPSRSGSSSAPVSTEQRQEQVREFLGDGPKTRKEIAAKLKVSPPRVQQIMVPMIDAGVLVSEQDPTTNRRRELWRLTANTSATEQGSSGDAQS